MMQRPRLVIAGTHSGVGKTTVTLAVMAGLKARGSWFNRSRLGLTLSILVTTRW